jgi:hypothetical protein
MSGNVVSLIKYSIACMMVVGLTGLIGCEADGGDEDSGGVTFRNESSYTVTVRWDTDFIINPGSSSFTLAPGESKEVRDEDRENSSAEYTIYYVWQPTDTVRANETDNETVVFVDR